jgi:hypothetical protein
MPDRRVWETADLRDPLSEGSMEFSLEVIGDLLKESRYEVFPTRLILPLTDSYCPIYRKLPVGNGVKSFREFWILPQDAPPAEKSYSFAELVSFIPGHFTEAGGYQFEMFERGKNAQKILESNPKADPMKIFATIISSLNLNYYQSSQNGLDYSNLFNIVGPDPGSIDDPVIVPSII